MEESQKDRKPAPSGRRNAITTFRHRDFRLLWTGQLISNIGDQMQAVAIGWQIFLLTNSPFQVGLVGVSRALPFMLLSFIGGAAADLVNRKRLLLVTQFVMMSATGILVITTATDTVTPWVIYAVSLISGATSAFDGPARQAIIPNLVPRDELSNAFTLTTVLRQTATVVGPGVGGLVIGLAGLSTTYGINALSFLAVVVALLLMSSVPQVKRGSTRGWDSVVGGLRYAWAEPLVIAPLALDFVVTCLRAFRSLLPVFARDVLRVGPQGLGLLHAAASVGALAGAGLLGAIGQVKNRVAWMLVTYALQGLFLVGFGLSTVFLVSILMLAAYGISDVVSEVMRTTIVQLKTPDDLRGRVSALSSMFTQGGPQLGQLQMGAVASLFSPVVAAVNGGTLVLLAVAGFSLLPSIRHALKNKELT